MTRQLLREATVVIEHDGSAYEFKALNSITASSSLGQTTGRRKTLFANTPKQYSVTSMINPTQISFNVYVTSGFPEQVLFDLIGMNSSNGVLSLPSTIRTTPKLCSISLSNTHSLVRAENCFVETINISLNKATPLMLEVVLNAAAVDVTPRGFPTWEGAIHQGSLPAPTPINVRVGESNYSAVESASISFQQDASWRDEKTLFQSGEEPYRHSSGFTEDFIISSTISGNYLMGESQTNKVTEGDLLLFKSGLSFFIENARIVHNIDIQSLYKYRLDVSFTETSGDAYIYFGE